MVATSTATTSLNALDRIVKGRGALPIGPSLNVFSARAIILCATARRCPQLNKRLNTQDKPENGAPEASYSPLGSSLGA